MARFLHRFYSCLHRNVSVMVISACFLLGLILGIRFSHTVDFSVSLMRGALCGAVSIVRLLSVLLLPLLFSALAVYFSKPRLLYGIAFLKAFLFAFVSGSVVSCFGSAGWLARWLIMFSDCMSLPLLWLYWLRHIPGRNPFQGTDTILTASGLALIAILDHTLIMPLALGI